MSFFTFVWQGTADIREGDDSSSSGLSSEACESKGFNRADLVCSSCDDLVQFKIKESIVSDCRKCCKDDGKKLERIKYPRAILEVCG